MTESQKSSPTLWLKCFSKSRNMVYYYNTQTKESVWDEPKPNIRVVDYDSLEAEEKCEKSNNKEDVKKLKSAKSPTTNYSQHVIGSPLRTRPNLNQPTTANPHRPPTNCTEQSSSEGEKSEAEILEILYAMKAKSQQTKQTQKQNGVVDPCQVNREHKTQKSSLVDDENVNEIDEDEIMEKLYLQKKMMNGGGLTTKKDCESHASQGTKRKSDEYSVSSNKKYSVTDYTTKQLIDVSKKLDALSQQAHSSSAIPRITSTNSSFKKYREGKYFTGKTKTPIQDRFNKKKEELIKKQEQNNTGSSLIKHSGQNILTGKSKTPIQDRFEKCKVQLLKEQEQKSNVRQGQYDNNSSVHDRLGWRRPILKNSQPSNEMPDNSIPKSGLKRKPSPAQGGEGDWGMTAQKRISFGEDEDSRLPTRKRISFGGVEVTRDQDTHEGFKRHSADSKTPFRKPIAFGQFKKRSLDSATSVQNQSTLAGVKRHSLESATSSNPTTFAGVKRHSLESATSSNPTKFDNLGRHDSSMSLETNSSTDESRTFDLRTKLQRRKLDTSNNSLSENSSQMDWEPSSANELSPREVNGPLVTNTVINDPPPVQKSRLNYSSIYLVCDTSALLNDYVFVEQLIVNGRYLGLPITIVVPFVVFDELDKLKVRDDVGHKARTMIKIIQTNRQQQSKHLQTQEGGKNREAVDLMELKVNDDLVINCCLQMRQTCKENELAVLVTSDINQENKAACFKVPSYDWNSFKRWAREFREYKLPSPENTKLKLNIKRSVEQHEERMDVDTGDNQLPEVATTSKNAQLQNCIRSHIEELKSDFQTFLHNVLDEAAEKEHGHLKKFVSNIKPSWNLYDYVIEVRKRWFLISSTMVSADVQEVIFKIISLLKKYSSFNSGKGEFKIEDVDDYFDVCASLGSIITKYFPKHGNFFLDRLKSLRHEWREAQSSLSCQNNIQNETEEDVQPVDVALENICNYLQSSYNGLKAQLETNKWDQEARQQLLVFADKITNLELVIEDAVRESGSTLSCNNKYLIRFHESISCFTGIRGSPFGFDITIENVIEFFQDISYREQVKKILYNLQHFAILIDEWND